MTDIAPVPNPALPNPALPNPSAPGATRRFVRADGPDKVTGSGRYAADLQLSGMLHAKFRYADVAHGRITTLDTSAARAMPGVLSVLTHADVPDVRYSPGISDRTLFAKDVVRFEGEVVAAVAATTKEIAQAAVDAIVVEIEPLPVVNDAEEAMAADSPLVHTDWESYEADEAVVRSGNTVSFSSITHGDVEAGLAAADHVITSHHVADASHAAPIEPRAIVAQWEGQKVTVWTSSQVPFDARAGICQTLQLPTNRVRVIVPHLGGGFGGKCGFHFEAQIAALAKAAKRPVKLVFSRREEFLAPDRRREGMTVEITSGVKNDGSITARKARIVIDSGAYASDAAFFPQLAAMHVGGPYKVPNVEIEAHLMYTNHQPSGSVRAPTAPQACWALEAHTDQLADTLGIDPVQFRLQNCVTEGDTGIAGQVYGAIGLKECIEKAVAASDYGAELPDDEAVGVAVSWWPSFPGPSGAHVKIDDDGAGQIITGAQECGTGAVMTLRQLAADEVGLQPEDFEIIYQDTGVAPYDTGATGSQTLINNGRAVVRAARQIADELRKLAADHLEAAPGDIVLADGSAHVAGTPTKNVSIPELAGIAAGGELLAAHGSAPPLDYPTVAATCVGEQGVAGWVAPQFACHAVRVKVDAETGVARVMEISTAHDSGTILNLTGALGQVHGGVLMGIGQALTEVTRYSDEGLQMNAGMLEYKLQTAADAPPITTRFVEPGGEGAGPEGAKGLAEAPNVPTAAAIHNAITKVIGTPVNKLPMTAERIWEVQQ